jgi:hypothetical protein
MILLERRGQLMGFGLAIRHSSSSLEGRVIVIVMNIPKPVRMSVNSFLPYVHIFAPFFQGSIINEH